MGKRRLAAIVLAFALVGLLCPALALAASDSGQQQAGGATFQPADLNMQALDGDDEGEDGEGLPADLNDSDYQVKFENTYDSPKANYIIVENETDTVLPQIVLYYGGDEDNAVPADAYTVTYQMLVEDPDAPQPGDEGWEPGASVSWQDIEGDELSPNNIYRLYITAIDGSGFTGAWNPDDHEGDASFWVITKNVLWPYDVDIEGAYAYRYGNWPYVTFYLLEGEEPSLSLSLYGEALSTEYYTVTWCNRDISPDTIYDPEAHELAILDDAPTTAGHYYAYYEGVDGYKDGGTVLFDIISPDDVSYERLESVSLFPEGSETVPNYSGASIAGMPASYEVTNVEIDSQDPVNAGDTVVTLEEHAGDAGSYWECRAESFGVATLKVTYRDLFGEEQYYYFNVSVVTEKYYVEAHVASGSDIALPGRSIEVVAEGRHVTYDDGNYTWDDDMSASYRWAVPEEYENLAYITVDENDSSRATVTFYGLPEGQDSINRGVEIDVTMLDEDDEGNEVELASDDLSLTVSSNYTEIWPLSIDEMEVGATQQVTVELREYSLDSEGPDGYDVRDDVLFRWFYDGEAVDVTDSAGNHVDEGTYDEETSRGSQVAFTIERVGDWETDLHVEASWIGEDDEGNPEAYSVEREYVLGERDYNAQLESEYDRVFSDGQLDVQFVTDEDVDYDEMDLVFTVGVWDKDQDAWAETFEEGVAYTVDGTVVTLDGAALAEACEEFTWIRVVAQLKSGDNVAAQADCWIEVRFASVDVDFHGDNDLMIGSGDAVNRSMRARVMNSENPDGYDADLEVLDVSIASEEPEEAGKSVLHLKKDYSNGDETSEDYWWYYDAQNYGTATLEVTYEDLDGNEQSYTFDVHVVRDVYGIDVRVLSDFRRALPGQSIELQAVGKHETDYEVAGDEEPLSFEWALGQGAEYAELQVHPDDPSRATVTFNELDVDANEGEGENYFGEDVVVLVTMYGQDGQGASVRRADEECRLRVESSFDELLVTGIEDAILGVPADVTAEVRRYSLESEGAGGYDVVENALFRWDFNDGDFEVADENGNLVSYDDYDDASRGAQVPFSVKRLTPRMCDIAVYAQWEDSEGEPCELDQRFDFEELYYAVWLDCERDALFNDGVANMQVRYDDNYNPETVDTVIDLGTWNSAAGEWEQPFTEDDEYTVDGTTITLDGAKIYETLGGEGWVDVRVTLMIGEWTVGSNVHSIQVRDTHENYDLPTDRDMLLGWGGTVERWQHAYVENTAHPDGDDEEFEIVNVEIYSQDPLESGGQVIELAKVFENGDETSENFWWNYRAVGFGSATIKVTYAKLNGDQEEHYFNVNVSGDVYEVDLNSLDGSNSALPGGTITLVAEARHLTNNGAVPMDDAVFQWNYVGDTECVESFQPNGSTCLVTFAKPVEGEEYKYGNVQVFVTVFEPEGGGMLERGSKDIWLNVFNQTTEIVCDGIDPDMAPGTTKNVTAEVHCYSVDESGNQVDEIVDNVLFRWYYDDEIVDVVDRNGNHVGSRVGDQHFDEASRGSSVPFTVKRLTGEDAEITLLATWGGDEGGPEGQIELQFYLNYVEPAEASWIRLAGSTRYSTMAAIVAEGWDHSDAVIIAKGDTDTGYKDALAAGVLAGVLDAPVVTIPSDPKVKGFAGGIEQAARAIERLGATKAYVMGGTAALKDNVVSMALKYSAVTEMKRVSGNNARLTSAAAMAEAAQHGQLSDTAFVATQAGYKDALAAAPLSYALHMPIILAKDKSTIDTNVIEKMKENGIAKAYLIGGPNALDDNVVAKLQANGIQVLGEGEGPIYKGKPMRLLAGTSAIQTSMNVAEFGIANGMSASTVGVATSEGFADALAGAALCGKKNGVLVLAKNASSASVTQFVPGKKDAIRTGYAFGGPNAIAENTFEALKAATASDEG